MQVHTDVIKESGPGDLDVSQEQIVDFLFGNLKCKDANKDGPLSGMLLLSSDVKTD